MAWIVTNLVGAHLMSVAILPYRKEEKGIQAVLEAVKRGVNFFDVSPYYGLTAAEEVLGKALKQLPRDSFVLSTKVGRYDTNVFDFSAERVKLSVEESMERLGVNFIDIIQCHDIEFADDLDQIARETIPTLLELKKEGKVRAIGVTGYPLEVFPYVLSCVEDGTVDVVLSYCHYCLQNDRLGILLPGLKKYRVAVVNASALSMGMLTASGPPDWHPADEETKQAARKADELCREKGVELATVALQFALNEDGIVSTLVGIDSVSTLEKNLEVLTSKVDWELVKEVRQVFDCVRNRRWSSGKFLGTWSTHMCREVAKKQCWRRKSYGTTGLDAQCTL